MQNMCPRMNFYTTSSETKKSRVTTEEALSSILRRCLAWVQFKLERATSLRDELGAIRIKRLSSATAFLIITTILLKELLTTKFNSNRNNLATVN